jgi:hypothetical protein
MFVLYKLILMVAMHLNFTMTGLQYTKLMFNLLFEDVIGVYFIKFCF